MAKTKVVGNNANRRRSEAKVNRKTFIMGECLTYENIRVIDFLTVSWRGIFLTQSKATFIIFYRLLGFPLADLGP